MIARLKWPALALVALALAVATPSRADAAFKMRLSVDGGANWTVLTDGNLDGIISTNGSLGLFNFSFTAAASKPAVANTPFQAELELHNVSIQSTGVGTLLIEATDTDYKVTPGLNNTAVLTTSPTGNTSGGGNMAFQSWVNYGAGGNQEFGGSPNAGAPGGLLATNGFQGPFTSIGIADVKSKVIGGFTNDYFSMTTRLVINATGSSQPFSFDSTTLLQTPAPGGLVLGLAAVPVLGLARLIRSRRRPEA